MGDADKDNRWGCLQSSCLLPTLTALILICTAICVTVLSNPPGQIRLTGSAVHMPLAKILPKVGKHRQSEAVITPNAPAEVVVASTVYWLRQSRSFNCSMPGEPLQCHMVNVQSAHGNATAMKLMNKAAALMHHLCNQSWPISDVRVPPRTIMFTLESEAYYKGCMNNHSADFEVSYRQCSQVG